MRMHERSNHAKVMSSSRKSSFGPHNSVGKPPEPEAIVDGEASCQAASSPIGSVVVRGEQDEETPYLDSFTTGKRGQRGLCCVTSNVSPNELVHRAFFLAKKTGEVVVGKQTTEIGDEGAKMVANRMHELGPTISIANRDQYSAVTSLSVCSHGIGPPGATALADALIGNLTLRELNFDHNSICAEGAAALSRALITVWNLHTLHLGSNSIGPDFPDDLAKCTSLAHLHLQHNLLEHLSIDLGNHPSLIKLELSGNNDLRMPDVDLIVLRKNSRNVHTEEIKKIDKGTSQKSQFRQHASTSPSDGPPLPVQKDLLHKQPPESVNWRTEELLKALLDVNLNICSSLIYKKEWTKGGDLLEDIPNVSDVQITLADRWNRKGWEVNFINDLLCKFTSLKSLNGLQEWPAPPLAPFRTWNLTNMLKNPLYECNFVKNRLRVSVSITELVLDKNDLCGRAAKDIAVALASSKHLTKFSARECIWDASIAEIANVLTQGGHLQTVNGLNLPDGDAHWDLKGCVLNAIDAAFIVRMLTNKGPLGNLCSLDLRGNNLQRDSAVMLANALSSVTNLSELNGFSLPPPPKISPRFRQQVEQAAGQHIEVHRQTDVPDSKNKDEDLVDSPLSGMSSPATTSPLYVRVTEDLDMRKRLVNGRVESSEFGATFGTCPIELSFFAIIVRPRLLLVDLNFSENLMGDIEIPYICAIMLELKDVLEKLHLNENGITLNGAQTLGTALARMQTMKVLRLNNNHIGTRGAEAICSGLAVNPTIQSIYLNEAKLGPFLPESLYKLTRLDFISIKNNDVIGIPVDFLRLKRLATLWVEGNPIEFPPPPIPFLGLKRLITWLRQSQNACAEKKTDEHLLHVDSFAKKAGSNASFSASDSDAEAARCSRSASTFGVNSRTTFQHNELWLKLAKRKSALSEEEQSEDEDKENAVLELCRLYRHGQQVQDVNFHPKFPIFVSCSEDRTVKMWEKNPDLKDDNIWTCSHTLKNHKDCITHVAFTGSDTNLMLASVSRDKMICLWLPDKDPYGPNNIWKCGQILGHKPAEKHHGDVRSLAFTPQGIDRMLATGSEDNTFKIWGPGGDTKDASEDEKRVRIVPLDDPRLDNIRECFQTFARGEIPGQVHNEAEKSLAGRRKRALTVDMNEFLEFAGWSGLLDCVSKTLMTTAFRAVSHHAKSDDDRHELQIEEFCELLFRIAKTAQGPAGKIFSVKKIGWSRFGMIEFILDTHVDLLNRYDDNSGLLDTQGDMGWACLYTVEAHLGTVVSLSWLPVKEPVLVSAGMDEKLKFWSFTMNMKGRGQWTNSSTQQAHDALIHDISFVCDGSKGEDHVIGVSSAADNTVMMWKTNILMMMQTTLGGQEQVRQYLLKRGQKMLIPDGICICCTGFRNDGKVFAAGCRDGAVLLWTEIEEDKWTLNRRFKCHNGMIHRIRFGGDECISLCVTISVDGKCCVLETKEAVPTIPIKCVSFTLVRQNASKNLLRRASREGITASKVERTSSNMSRALSEEPSIPAPIMKSPFPPRQEMRMFEIREAVAWSIEVPQDKMEWLDKRMANASKRQTREFSPNFGGQLLLRCQEASPNFVMELSYEASSVWYKMEAGIAATSIESFDPELFPGWEIVSPIVVFTPQRLSFRNAVTIKVPHHCATTDDIVLLQCIGASPKNDLKESKLRPPAKWEPLACTTSSRHVSARLQRIHGAVVVLSKKNIAPVKHQVYAIPLGLEGRPAMVTGAHGLMLQMGETWQGQIEIIPATSVQSLTAFSSIYFDQWKKLPVYTIGKGDCISKIVARCQTLDANVEVRAISLSSMTWHGYHLIISVEFVAQFLNAISLSRPATLEDRPVSQVSHPCVSLQSAAPAFLGSSSTGADRQRAAYKSAADFVLALEDQNGAEVLCLEAIRVVVNVPTITVLAKWGYMEAATIEVQMSSGSSLSQLREEVNKHLLSPRSPHIRMSPFGDTRAHNAKESLRTSSPALNKLCTTRTESGSDFSPSITKLRATSPYHYPLFSESAARRRRSASPDSNAVVQEASQHQKTHGRISSESLANWAPFPAEKKRGRQKGVALATQFQKKWSRADFNNRRGEEGQRPQTCSSTITRFPLPATHTQDRPHTSVGMCAVPAASLSSLYFTTGGALYDDSGNLKGRKRMQKSAPNRALGAQTSSSLDSLAASALPPKPQPSVFRHMKSAGSSNFFPQEYENVLPAAVVGSRGYGFLVLPKSAPDGAARQMSGASGWVKHAMQSTCSSQRAAPLPRRPSSPGTQLPTGGGGGDAFGSLLAQGRQISLEY